MNLKHLLLLITLPSGADAIITENTLFFNGCIHCFDALPEVIALAVVIGSYLWKRHTIFSVVVGTVVYMILVQLVF